MRNRLAKLSAATGAADPDFTPDADQNVLSLALSGSSLYAGGDFEEISEQPRARLAKLAAANGNVNAEFNPGADDTVQALEVSADGTSLYAGGFFDNIAGQAEQGVAKLSTSTGADDGTFDANANDVVRTLALSGSGLYVGGDFAGVDSIGGEDRNRIARLSAANWNATAWSPNANANVNSVEPAGSLVYAGGDFTNIGTLNRTGLAVLSATSGNAFSGFNANLGSEQMHSPSRARRFTPAAGSRTSAGDPGGLHPVHRALTLLAPERHRQRTRASRVAVLAEVDALPGAERERAATDRESSPMVSRAARS